jgi:uncharacterized cupredoxin-like copper-binding protein
VVPTAHVHLYAKAIPHAVVRTFERRDTAESMKDKAGDKGEVSELEPGKSGRLTINLKPGKYLLICNVAGHFVAGMWSPFEVTK